MDTREQLDSWRKEALSSWKDHRIVDSAWVDTHIWFWMHLYSDLAQISAELTGVSFRQKHGDWLMVLKIVQESIPMVGFVTSKNPTRCMLKARDLLRNGGLTWTRDKYA